MNRRRARHYWDPELRFAQHMGSALGIGRVNPRNGQPTEGIAWDSYLLYPRGPAAIETPSFWMHQLGIDSAPTLDPATLQAEVRRLLT